MVSTDNASHGWQLKFRDIGQHFYHLEELNPVKEHSEQFRDIDDEILEAQIGDLSPVPSDLA